MILLLMISSISPGAVVSQVRVYSFVYIYYIYTNLFYRVCSETFYYAPNFEKVEEAYCFGLVPPFVR